MVLIVVGDRNFHAKSERRRAGPLLTISEHGPPDAEVLVVDRTNNAAIQEIQVEVTQRGRYSRNLYDVIGKKLKRKYHEDTVLVVLIEEAQELPLAETYEFLDKINVNGLRVVIIGGADTLGTFKVLPWELAVRTENQRKLMQF